MRVDGLRELNRDLGKINKGLQRELQAAIRKIAEPVAEDVRRRARAEGIPARTIGGIRAGSSRGGAVVRQSLRRTTGTRPDFGRLQMGRAFIPAAEENTARVVRDVEEMLDKLTRNNGFSGGLF